MQRERRARGVGDASWEEILNILKNLKNKKMVQLHVNASEFLKIARGYGKMVEKSIQLVSEGGK